MKRFTRFFAVTLGLGLVLGGLAAAANHQFKKEFVQAKADAETVATFYKVYDNSFNNVAGSPSGYNYSLLRFNFSGSKAYFDSPSDVEYTDESILSKIKLNGVALSTYESARIRSWHDQPWLYVYYPAVSAPRSLLEFESGIVVNGVEINSFALSLNNDSRWDLSIYGDELVKNSDYLLFTPSEYSMGGNDDWPAFNMSANDAFKNNSFAVQFVVNMTADELTKTYTTLRFGTGLVGTQVFQVIIDYDANTYVYYGGSYISTTNLTTITPNVDHLFEFYCIKTSPTSTYFLLGIDGKLIFKSAATDLSGAPETTFFGIGNHVQNDGPRATVSSYKSCATTTATAINRFGKNKLHSEDISFSDNGETNNCKSYYGPAKSFFNTYLNPAQRKAFATSGDYSQLKARLVAWAAANGEDISFDATTGEIVVNSNRISPFIDKRSQTALIIAISTVTLSMVGFVVLFILKKKKAAR